MRNIGQGGRRTTWQQSAPGMHVGSRRTKSQCAPPFWSGRTPHWDSRLPSCGRTAAAVRTSWPAMRLSTACCKQNLVVRQTEEWMRRRQSSLPHRIQPRLKHQGNLNLSLCWSPVAVCDAGVLDACWRAVRHDGSSGSQDGLWRASGSCTERKWAVGWSHRWTCGKLCSSQFKRKEQTWLLVTFSFNVHTSFLEVLNLRQQTISAYYYSILHPGTR